MALACHLANHWDPSLVGSTAACAWFFVNGNFGIALISALAGSFAGAYGAQVIAELEGARRRALEELRATNAATALSVFTVNVMLVLKQQHLIPLLAQYREDRQRFLDLLAAPSTGPREFQYTANWQTFPWTRIPDEALTELIFKRIDAMHPITLVNMLNGTVAHLEATLRQRDEFIKDVLSRGSIPPPEAARMYFGTRSPDGRQDSRYPDLLNAAENYTDAAIIFGATLTDQLIKHAETAAKRVGKRAPSVVKANYRIPIEQGLIPRPSDFSEVLTNMGIDPRLALSSLQGPPPSPSGKTASAAARFAIWWRRLYRLAVDRVRRRAHSKDAE